MTVLSISETVAVALPLIGFTAWLFRMEGRVNNHAQSLVDIKDDMHDVKRDISTMKNDTSYIRGQIDQFLDDDR